MLQRTSRNICFQRIPQSSGQELKFVIHNLLYFIKEHDEHYKSGYYSRFQEQVTRLLANSMKEKGLL